MKNVIITGADGFVGSNTVRAFLRHGEILEPGFLRDKLGAGR